MGKYSSFDRCLLRGSELTIGGPHTTGTKMPEELFDVGMCAVSSRRNTHTPMANTPTRADDTYAESVGVIIVFLLLRVASGLRATLEEKRRDGRGPGLDKGGSRAGLNQALLPLRNQRLAAEETKDSDVSLASNITSSKSL